MTIDEILQAEVEEVSFKDVEFLKDYDDVRLGCGGGCGGDVIQPK